MPMYNKKQVYLIILTLTAIFCLPLMTNIVFALSNKLDTYQGTGFTDVGKESVDSFTITKGDFYCYHRITKSTRWNTGTYAEMKLTPLKKEWLGYKTVSNKAQTIQVSPNDTSYYTLPFTELSDGTYKIYFQSTYKDNVDFDGIVYDDK